MDRLFELVPENRHSDLERYLLALIDELRRRRNERHITEVCSKRATVRTALNAAVRRVAHLSDEQALSILGPQFPAWTDESLVANLQLARKRQKKEARARQEREIAAMVRDGRSNSDIATEVGVSLSTAARKAARAVRGELP